VTDNIDMDRYLCPCCGNLTLDEEPPGMWLICEVCWWEDDPVQFEDPEYRGGANSPSLNKARQYFRTIGFSAPEHLAHMRREDPSRLPK
jgi:Cysteine-rich CPCC